MITTETFFDDIDKQVNERQGDVIKRAVEILSARSKHLKPEFRCSYAYYIPSYINYKTLITRYNRKKYSYCTTTEEEATILERLQAFNKCMDIVHDKMYKNPCKDCTICNSRKKTWPKETPYNIGEYLIHHDITDRKYND